MRAIPGSSSKKAEIEDEVAYSPASSSNTVDIEDGLCVRMDSGEEATKKHVLSDSCCALFYFRAVVLVENR